jgi:hypothetical protein
MRRLRRGGAQPSASPDPEPAADSHTGEAEEAPLEQDPEEAVTEDAPASEDAAALPTIRQLLSRGQVGKALAVAAEPGVDPDGRAAALLAAIEAGEAILAELGLAARPASPERGVLHGVMLAPSEGAKRLLVVFGADDGGFLVPLGLAGAKRPHLLFVQDRRRCLSLIGVERLGTTYDSCLANILRIARHLGARSLFCLGAGLGTYSALRYGLDLGAAGVAGLGTLTRLDSAQALPGRRDARQVAKLLRVTETLGGDLEKAYAEAPARPRLVLCRAVAAEGAATVPLFAGLDEVAFMDAPAGATGRLLAWAEASGKLRLLVGQMLAAGRSGRSE